MSIFHHHKAHEIKTHYEGQRFIVTEPVDGGYAFWGVHDTQSPHEGANFTVLEIWKGVVQSGDWAHQLAQHLNAGTMIVRD